MSSHGIGGLQVCADVMNVTAGASVRREQLVEQVGLTSDPGKGWKGCWKEPWYLRVVSLTEAIS